MSSFPILSLSLWMLKVLSRELKFSNFPIFNLCSVRALALSPLDALANKLEGESFPLDIPKAN